MKKNFNCIISSSTLFVVYLTLVCLTQTQQQDMDLLKLLAEI